MKTDSAVELDNLLKWLESYNDNNINLGLTNVEIIAKRANLLAINCPVITVAGTNGKGSTVATIEEIAIAANLKIGSYTSPHLFSFLERIKINATPVTAEECIASFKYLQNNMDPAVPLTYFEFATLIALHVFQNYPLDLIVLEVGLGGRLDAVNIVNNKISVISSIALDHCKYLGDTIDKIAYEKSGIIKANTVVICGASNGIETIATMAKAKNSQFRQIKQDFTVQELPFCWSYSSFNRTIADLTKPVFPTENAACAIAALEALPELPINEQQIRQGIARVKVPGRFQLYNDVCKVVFDVAHNPAAANWLAKQISTLNIKGKVHCIIGICRDKDWQGIILPFVNIVDYWHPIGIENTRLHSAEELSIHIQTLTTKPVSKFYNIQTTITQILTDSSNDDLLLVFGSFFTVSLAMQVIYAKK